MMMPERTLTAAAVALTCLAAAVAFANMVQAAPPAGDIPPQALAAGYTTLALNADFTRGIHASVNCAGATDETPGFDWYLGIQGGIASGNVPCGGVTYPFNDGGTTVLRIENGNCCYGGILGRNGISSASFYGSVSHDFPLNLYMECTIRFDAADLTNFPLWANCFAGDVHVAQGKTPYPPDPQFNDLQLELNINEFHGSHPGCAGGNCDEVGGVINWNCAGPNIQTWGAPGCLWGNGLFGDANLQNVDPTFNPANYNTYGMLIQQTDATHYTVCGYLNNHQTQCSTGQTINHNTSGGDTSLNALCPDVSVFGGNTGCYEAFERVVLLADLTGQFSDGLEGLGGSDFPADYREHMYVKSYRVFTCANWQTTECSPFNPN